MIRPACAVLLFASVLVVACGGGGSAAPGTVATNPGTTSTSPPPPPTSPNATGCTGATASTYTTTTTLSTPALTVPSGLTIQTIANVGGARELVALPSGDLLAGTTGSSVYIVPNAEASGTEHRHQQR